MREVKVDIPLLIKIGGNIYKYRNAQNISLEDLSKMTGISKRSLLKIEDGKYYNLTVLTCVNLAFVLKVPFELLFA